MKTDKPKKPRYAGIRQVIRALEDIAKVRKGVEDAQKRAAAGGVPATGGRR